MIMIPFMEKLTNKKTEEDPAKEACKKFLKNTIMYDTTVGTIFFRNDLYNRLIRYGIWNNYDFCNKLDEDEFIAKARYKKNKDIQKVFKIQEEIKKKHFGHLK